MPSRPVREGGRFSRSDGASPRGQPPGRHGEARGADDRRRARSPSKKDDRAARTVPAVCIVTSSARTRRVPRLRPATRRSVRPRRRPRSRSSRRPGSARGRRRPARPPGRRAPRTTMNKVGSARTLRYSSAVASTLARQLWSLHSQTISIRSPSGNDSPSSRIRSFTDRKSASFFAARNCERGIARDSATPPPDRTSAGIGGVTSGAQAAFRAASAPNIRALRRRSPPSRVMRRTGRRPAVPRLEREPHEHAATTLPPPIGRADPPTGVERCQPGRASAGARPRRSAGRPREIRSEW